MQLQGIEASVGHCVEQGQTTKVASELEDGQFSNYHCCAEWHLARMSPICSLVYPFALRISKDSQKFSCSARGVAEFFGYGEKSAQRGYGELTKAGFFVLLQEGHFEPSVYQVLTHREWSTRNPDQCAVKIEYPWTGEGDPLGQKLYAVSGGRIKFKPFQVEAYRDLGLSEDEILYWFERFLAENEAKYHYPANRKKAGVHFLMFLREVQKEGTYRER